MRTDKLLIRPAVDADLGTLLAIFNASRAHAGCFTRTHVDRETFATLVEGEVIYLAALGERTAGFVSIWRADRFIHHLYVAPEHQSHGIGSALLRECIARYGRSLSLKCDCRNHRARRYYLNKGWHPRETGMGEDGPWERLYSP